MDGSPFLLTMSDQAFAHEVRQEGAQNDTNDPTNLFVSHPVGILVLTTAPAIVPGLVTDLLLSWGLLSLFPVLSGLLWLAVLVVL